ncbi:Transposon Tf2-11 polyprotein [Vitis vinifera]|uniref:Transposon Tf2-11 polyprotein n=1 Tax=Vitis vinifera TaxID=29760 RepID=A0A438CNW3_VITVI|nr:Transposon Tf2-11 polyprotein [Vitis vinifera]
MVRYSMDFIEGLPNSNGHSVIMAVVDRLSKYAHFIPVKHLYTAVTVAKAFVSNVVRLHGIPTSIVSDRDKTDGQTEVVNRTLEQYMRCFAGLQPQKWVEWVPWAEFNYNTSTHSSTKFSPFEAVYGVPPPSFLSYISGTARVQAVDEYLQDRDEILKELRHNLRMAQDRMKSHADQCRRDIQFNVGDFIYGQSPPHPLNFRLVSDESILLPQPESILAQRMIHKGKCRPRTEFLGAPIEDAPGRMHGGSPKHTRSSSLRTRTL